MDSLDSDYFKTFVMVVNLEDMKKIYKESESYNHTNNCFSCYLVTFLPFTFEWSKLDTNLHSYHSSATGLQSASPTHHGRWQADRVVTDWIDPLITEKCHMPLLTFNEDLTSFGCDYNIRKII